MALPYATNLAAWTLDHVIPEVENTWFLECPLLADMKDMAGKKLIDGGLQIRQPLVYRPEAAGNIIWFTGGTPLPCDPYDIGNAANYPWRWLSAGMSIPDTDVWLNEGPEGIVKLMDQKKDNLVSSLTATIATAVNGSQVGLSMLGLDDIMSAASTLGDIPVADMARWVALVEAAPGGALTYQYLDGFQNRVSETGKDKDLPTLATCSVPTHAKIKAIAQEQQRFEAPQGSARMAKLGFTNNIVINQTPYVIDPYVKNGSAAINSPTHVINYINSRYLQLRIHRKANFKVMPPRTPFNQLVTAVFVVFGGNLTCSYRRRNGRITDIQPNV